MSVCQWIDEEVSREFDLIEKRDLSIQEMRAFIAQANHNYIGIITIKKGIIYIEQKKSGYYAMIGRVNYLKHSLYEIFKTKPWIETSFIFDYSDELKGSKKLPVFGLCKRKNSRGILIPDETEEDTYDQATLISQICPWEKKISRAYFRGATTGAAFIRETLMKLPRVRLAQISKENPNIVDAKFSKILTNHFKDGKALELFYINFNIVPFEETGNVVRYRYGIDVDGNTNGWKRCRYILSSNTLCIKHKSPYIQWFYSLLKPNEHYLEVERDFSDLIEKIKWAEKNTAACLKMIQNSSQLAKAIFSKSAQREYLYQTLKKYHATYNVHDKLKL